MTKSSSMAKEEKETKVGGYSGWRWVQLGGHVVKRIVVCVGGMAFILPENYKNNPNKQFRATVVSAGQVFKTQADAKGGVDREVFVVRGYDEKLRYERVKVRGTGELNAQNYLAIEPNGELRYIHPEFMAETEAEAAKFIIDQIRETLVERTGKDRALLKLESAMRKKLPRKRSRRR